jgi:hypothetical protein
MQNAQLDACGELPNKYLRGQKKAIHRALHNETVDRNKKIRLEQKYTKLPGLYVALNTHDSLSLFLGHYYHGLQISPRRSSDVHSIGHDAPRIMPIPVLSLKWSTFQNHAFRNNRATLYDNLSEEKISKGIL